MTVFFITTLPIARFDLGPLPVYISDFLVAVLLDLYLRSRESRPAVYRPITLLTLLFFYMILVSELNGYFTYRNTAASLYMFIRYSLGISLVLILPGFIETRNQLNFILKALLLGMLLNGAVTLLTSLPPTRAWVLKMVFNIPFIVPRSGSIESGMTRHAADAAIRGRSLLGATNMTGGFLSALFPLSIVAIHFFKNESFWKRVAWIACIVTPLGALATYSRGTWLGIGAIIFLFGVVGLAGGRRIFVPVALLVFLIISVIEIPSQFLFFERIQRSTERALNHEEHDVAETERFHSFTEPFDYLAYNSSYLLFGEGSVGGKLRGRGLIQSVNQRQNRYKSEDGDLATHSAFSMAFYNFGLIAAFAHVGIMFFAYRLIIRNIRLTSNLYSEHKILWQALLGCWVGLTPWWLFGHAATSIPRGSMFFFCMVALLLTFEKLRQKEMEEK